MMKDSRAQGGPLRSRGRAAAYAKAKAVPAQP